MFSLETPIQVNGRFEDFQLGVRSEDMIGTVFMFVTSVVHVPSLDWNVKLFMFDVGIRYELGRWRFRDEPNAPELTLEPYFEARIIYLPIDITGTLLGNSISEDLSSQVPVLGLRAFIDVMKHWNLELIGDYGGWGGDDNHQTYQGAAYLGYRWPGWGAHWNLQVGYRAVRLFEMRQDVTDISMDVRGANITFAVEF